MPQTFARTPSTGVVEAREAVWPRGRQTGKVRRARSARAEASQHLGRMRWGGDDGGGGEPDHPGLSTCVRATAAALAIGDDRRQVGSGGRRVREEGCCEVECGGRVADVIDRGGNARNGNACCCCMPMSPVRISSCFTTREIIPPPVLQICLKNQTYNMRFLKNLEQFRKITTDP